MPAPAIGRPRSLLPPPDPVPQPPAGTGGIDRLAADIEAHRDGIFILAQPNCETGRCSFTAVVETASDSAVVKTVTWTGPVFGKPYGTQIRFTPSFDESGSIGGVLVYLAKTA